MAAIDRRGKYWRARIRRSGFPFQTRSFDTKVEAEAWARGEERDMDRGSWVDRTEAEKNTLGDVIARYLREVTPTKRGAGPEASRLNALARRPLAQLKMSAVSSKHVAAYRDDRSKQVSAGTVNKELNHLSHVFETARREWGISMHENPVRHIRRPTAPRPRSRRLEGDEGERLLSACAASRNPYLLPIVMLALETAMRQGELVGLRWVHVDLKKRVAYLPLTKNGEARAVPLSRAAGKVLEHLPKSISGQVFPGLTTEAVKRAFIRATVRANITDFHFHDLRHEATSRLAESGLDVVKVASITGHKTLQVLYRYYVHLRAENLAKELR